MLEKLKTRKNLILLLIAALVVIAAVTTLILVNVLGGQDPPVEPVDNPGSSATPTTGDQDPLPTTPQPESPSSVVPQDGLIDEVESIGEWQGTGAVLHSEQAPEGNSWLAAEQRDAANAALLYRTFVPALDLTAYSNGYLHMWIYVEDITQVLDGQIELTSSGTSDDQEKNWTMLQYVKKSGWNEVYLPFASANAAGGDLDLSACNFMRIYIVTEGNCKLGIDKIQVTNDTPPPPSHLDENGEFVVDEVESLAGWYGTEWELVRDNAPKGQAYLSGKTRDGDAYILCQDLAPIDISQYKNGCLHLWVYIKDSQKLAGGEVELSSAGGPDTKETSWELVDYITKDGWNELYLPLADAHSVGGETDLSAVNYFRIYLVTTQETPVGVDYISLSDKAPSPGDDTPEEKPSLSTGDLDDQGEFVLDIVEKLSPWEGTGLQLLKQGQAKGNAYLASQSREEGAIVFARGFSDVDIRDYREGYAHLWLYISDIDQVTGGQVELCSGNEADVGETSWNLLEWDLTNGWNELYLPFSQANQVGGGTDFSKFNFMRVYVLSNTDQLVGVDYITLSKTAPAKADPIDPDGNYVLDPIRSIYPWSGSPMTFQTSGGYENGAVWISSRLEAAGDVQFFRTFLPMDLSDYQAGSLRLWVYVEDISKVTGGMVELTSSGTVDEAEISWPLLSYITDSGWNELYLPIKDGIPQGSTAFDISRVNCMRVVISLGSASTTGIDHICMTEKLPEIDTSEYDAAVEEAYTRSLIYTGADNNRAAIAAVLAKAKNGDAITLVTLGDSITAGAVAAPGNEWAALVRDWLDGLDGNPANNNVTLVNAGIGSTEGVFGVTRLERDVLAHHPDLVIVDFGTNDYGLPHGAEAYEGILCKLIGNGIATINSNVCPLNGNNIQDAQIPINQAYGVPQISFRSAYYELSQVTDIRGLRAVDIWSSDQVHPTDAGHKLLAELLTRYMQREILDRNVQPDAQDTTLPESVTSNGFDDAVLIENFTQNDHVQVSANGWTGDYSARIYQLSTEGWQTSTVGSSLTFDVDGGYFYLFFALTPQSGDLEIQVDGVVKETINWAYLGTGYMNVQHVLHLGGAGHHQVTLILRDNPQVENDWFGICAVGASNFDGVIDENQPLVLDPVETITPWFGDRAFTVETSGGHDGNWLSTTRNDAGDAVFCRGFSPTDISSYGYLHVWMYVEDLETVTQGWLELSSNGGALVNQTIKWNLLDYARQDGWNELYLPIDQAVAVGTDPFDPTALDLLRMYVGLPNDTAKAGIDNLYMTMEAPQIPPALDDLVLDLVKAIDPWIGSPMTLETTGGYTQGADWLKAAVASGDIVFCRGFSPFNISDYMDGYLHLRVYVDDIAKITGGMVEITSAGYVDEEELYWNLKDYLTQNGWNDLYLPLENALKQGTRPFDPSNLNCIRLVAIQSGGAVVGIDDISITQKAPQGDLCLDSVTTEVVWSGTSLQLETTGGYQEGADWISGSISAAGDTYFFRNFAPSKDLSAYENGCLRLWIYVDDISKFAGGMVEITSSGTVDNGEISWPLRAYITKSGWNNVLLPISEGVFEGTDPFDITSVNCIRVVVRLSDAGKTGVDDIYATPQCPSVDMETYNK